MFTLIGSIFKYSLLVLTVLVLSHIVQIKGTSVSKHVENAMNWVSGITPKAPDLNRITADLNESVRTHTKQIEKVTVDNDVSAEDQKQLNRIIKNSAAHK